MHVLIIIDFPVIRSKGVITISRMHPLSFAELKLKTQKDLMELLELGGFPEPYFSNSEIESKRWSREYRTRLVREDLVQLEKVHDLGNIELLAMRLPELVGSPLSINALREDLQVSHKAVVPNMAQNSREIIFYFSCDTFWISKKFVP